MLKGRIIKVVSKVVLGFFLYTFILYEPLLGAKGYVEEKISERKYEEVGRNVGRFLLPYKYGRVVGGGYVNSDRLVIYIQDLHCHSEVQKNIYEIIKMLDGRYNVSKIFVEGAPKGKVDTTLLSSLPESVKGKTLDSLLSKGLISGAEYYAVKEEKDKLYGLEDWSVYLENLKRIRNILSNKEEYLSIADNLNKKVLFLKQRYLTGKVKKLEKFLLTKNFNKNQRRNPMKNII